MSYARFRLSVLMSMLLFPGWNLGTAQTAPQAHAAAVLFQQFETVFYARSEVLQDFDAPDNDPHTEKDLAVMSLPVREAAYSELHSLGNATWAEMLKSSEAVWVGAKDFGAPVGLGPVHSRHCAIMVLRDHNAVDLQRYFTSAPVASVAGASVWHWTARLGEFGEEDASRPSELYAAVIAHSYLVISNDLKELQTTVAGLSIAERPDVLSGLKDWKFLSTQKLWGYRRYRLGETANPVAAGTDWVKPGASALLLYADFEHKTVVIRLLSSEPRADTASDSAVEWNAGAKKNSEMFLFEAEGGGIWAATLPLTQNEASFDHLFEAISLLGYGVYL